MSFNFFQKAQGELWSIPKFFFAMYRFVTLIKTLAEMLAVLIKFAFCFVEAHATEKKQQQTKQEHCNGYHTCNYSGFFPALAYFAIGS